MCLPFWIWEEGKINSDKTRMEKKKKAYMVWFGCEENQKAYNFNFWRQN